MKRVRCAIYTRKSSEEGLEQSFNSLHAQREACEAFIKSQKSEGWALLPDYYDDGGLSGGTLERPALERLLTAVDAGQLDLIVVYKVDRLTRSLSDFSKLVERLDGGALRGEGWRRSSDRTSGSNSGSSRSSPVSRVGRATPRRAVRLAK